MFALSAGQSTESTYRRPSRSRSSRSRYTPPSFSELSACVHLCGRVSLSLQSSSLTSTTTSTSSLVPGCWSVVVGDFRIASDRKVRLLPPPLAARMADAKKAKCVSRIVCASPSRKQKSHPPVYFYPRAYRSFPLSLSMCVCVCVHQPPLHYPRLVGWPERTYLSYSAGRSSRAPSAVASGYISAGAKRR